MAVFTLIRVEKKHFLFIFYLLSPLYLLVFFSSSQDSISSFYRYNQMNQIFLFSFHSLFYLLLRVFSALRFTFLIRLLLFHLRTCVHFYYTQYSIHFSVWCVWEGRLITIILNLFLINIYIMNENWWMCVLQSSEAPPLKLEWTKTKNKNKIH